MSGRRGNGTFDAGNIIAIIPAPPDLWVPTPHSWSDGPRTTLEHRRVVYLALIEGIEGYEVDFAGYRDRWVEMHDFEGDALDSANYVPGPPCDQIRSGEWYCEGHSVAPDGALAPLPASTSAVS